VDESARQVTVKSVDDPTPVRTSFDVVRDVLAELAPGEERFLPEVWEIYRRAPAKRRTRDRILGAGIPTDTRDWTSIVLLAVGSTLLAAAETPAEDSGPRGVASRLRRLRDRFLGRVGPEPAAPVVRPGQRPLLVAAIRAKATATGISEERVDALVAAAERSWLSRTVDAEQTRDTDADADAARNSEQHGKQDDEQDDEQDDNRLPPR
jgi:hypothetical protein